MPEVLKLLQGDSPRWVAQAPGRLDVMGGLAEYSGALVLGATVADEVCVGVQRQADDILSITLARSGDQGGCKPTVIPMSSLREFNGTPVDSKNGRELIESVGSPTLSCVIGAVAEIIRDGSLPPGEGGLSIAVGSTLDKLRDVGANAAMSASTLLALAGAVGTTLDPAGIAKVCQRIENVWLQLPVGISDAACVLWGEPQALMQIRCELSAVGGSIALPNDLEVMGIDCGTIHEDAILKYERVRTAAFMGRSLIDRIVKHDGDHHMQWDGHLARVTANDYVERFRDRLPTKLKGSEFLERFGETGDPLTTVDPSFTYRIRSRAEHHIYEHQRACRFVECLTRGIRTGDADAFAEVGDLMYASHWSYGQRCGLGSVATDLLVNLIREQGAGADIYGAKISGRGCGGVVVVLMRSTDKAMAAIEKVADLYQTKTGRSPTFIRGSAPGAMIRGAQQL